LKERLTVNIKSPMKLFTHSFKRSLAASLAGLMLVPASVAVFSLSDSDARGVAVRGPRGGAAAVRGPVRAPAYRAPAVRAPAVRGVARRTARRTTRRLYALPVGYTTTVIGGVNYYYAGGLYYEPVYEGSTVVYVQVVFDD
jgi:hypothetical protein